MPTILFVEDDIDLTEMVNEWLTAEGYTLEVAYDGDEGWETLKQQDYDVIILDWQLPGLSGAEICRRYRDAGGVAPVVMLTGRAEIADKEEGFGIGVDDYVTKPFNLKELSARLRALLRRPHNGVKNVLTHGNLELDLVKRKITRGGAIMQLLPQEFDLLEYFMRRPDDSIATDILLQRISSVKNQADAIKLNDSIKQINQKLCLADDQQPVIEFGEETGYGLRKQSKSSDQ